MGADVIRIAFCHYTADICGGSDRSLYDIVTHLPRDRFTPSMILKRGDPMAHAYRKHGIEVIEVRLVSPRRAMDLSKHINYAANYFPSVMRVRRAILDLDADIVHVNTLYNLVGPLAARLACRPLVWHVREILHGSRAAAAMLRLVPMMAERAVAISPAVADTLKSCGDRLRMIPNGVDLSDYDVEPDTAAVRREFNLAPGQPVVTVIGRLEPWKGQHILIEAVKGIAAAIPDVRAFVVGGPAVNKPRYAEGLRARCAELDISDRVTFTGIRTDIPELLATSSVLVLPTVTPEPFGRTIIEAMAARRAVIATNMGGPLETVVDGVTGFLVPPNDAAAIAAKAIDLLRDNELRARMGRNGRERAMEKYSLQRLVGDMGRLFDEVHAGQHQKKIE
jgi:glycosyltransferase involved in cell wall biosynthesis